jgi:hypothetical protein
MTEWHLLTYGVLKVVAYSAVCLLGLRWVGGRERWLLPMALALGLLRAGMGLAFGVGIFFASAWVVAQTSLEPGGQALAYVTVYVPVRWVEWGLIAMLLTRPARSLRGFVLGATARDRLWRLCGIAVSCCADIPVLLCMGGLPVGRMMC